MVMVLSHPAELGMTADLIPNVVYIAPSGAV